MLACVTDRSVAGSARFCNCLDTQKVGHNERRAKRGRRGDIVHVTDVCTCAPSRVTGTPGPRRGIELYSASRGSRNRVRLPLTGGGGTNSCL